MIKLSDITSKSWKTTSAGIGMITTALVSIWKYWGDLSPETINLAIASVLGGIGLIVARDNNKSSQDVGATPEARLSKILDKQAALEAEKAKVIGIEPLS